MNGYLHPDVLLALTLIGALAFGIVMGWVTYRTLRNSQVSGLSDIATVIGAVGGAAVTALFERENGAFGAYCIGLALGFFMYLRTAREPDAPSWLGGTPGGGRPGEGPSGPPVGGGPGPKV